MLEQRGRPALGQGQGDAGVGLAEGGQGPGHERGQGGGERPDAQPPGAQAAQRVQVAAGGGQAADHGLGVREQAAPFVGQRDAAGQPVEQPGAGLRLERGHLPGHR